MLGCYFSDWLLYGTNELEVFPTKERSALNFLSPGFSSFDWYAIRGGSYCRDLLEAFNCE